LGDARIVLLAEKYTKLLTDVDMWVELKGPDFDKVIYGIMVMATSACVARGGH